MYRLLVLSCVLVSTLTCCAVVRSVFDPPPSNSAVATASNDANSAEPANAAIVSPEVVEVAPVSAGAEPQQALPQASTTAAGQGSLTKVELAIWNDPAFRKQFAQSYLAETDVEPSVSADERESIQAVLELIASDQLEAAAAELEERTIDTSSAVFDFMLANIYFQLEDFEQAASNYETAVTKHPKFRRAWGNLGLIRVRLGNLGDATNALTRVIELGGGDAYIYGSLGFAYLRAGNFLSAESAYRMATLLDPTTIDWRRGLAESLFKQERYADASALIGQLLQDNPDQAELWTLQALAFIGQDEPLRAAQNYEIVNALGGSTVGSLTNLGDIYVNEKLYELGVDAYLRALEYDAGSVVRRALAAARMMNAYGSFDQARRLLDGVDSAYAAELDTEATVAVLRLRALLAIAEGTGDEEAAVLKRIIEIDPLDGAALIQLGQYEERNSNIEQAVFYFERAASLDDFEARAKLRHGELLVRQGNYKRALPFLRRSQALDPQEAVRSYLEQVERVSQGR